MARKFLSITQILALMTISAGLMSFLFSFPELAGAATTKTIFLTTTGANTWTVPSDWNSSNNTIELIGGGGGGSTGTSGASFGAGGGGGAYSATTSVILTPGASITYAIGAGGAGATSGDSSGIAGGDTYLCNVLNSGGSCDDITDTAVRVGAKGGAAGANGTAAGGSSASGIGTTRYSGGAGGSAASTWAGSGGGGAGGPNGIGAAGGSVTPVRGGAGGGGSGGGSAASNTSSSNGTAGGNNFSASGGGSGGTSGARAGSTGSNGGGGGGGYGACDAGSPGAGGTGGAGTEWDASHGSGGGGGGSGNNCGAATMGGNAGLYGGGGGGVGNSGGGTAGSGAQGIIVITYAPLKTTLSKPPNNLGLVGYWSFDDGSGTTATDFSGNGNAGTLISGPAWINGKRGKALSFDGVASHVSFTTANVGIVNSASLWLKFQDSGDGVILGDTTGTYFFYADQTSVYYSAGLGNFVSVAHGGLPAGAWMHLAVVRNGTSVTFYENGVQLGAPQTLSINTVETVSTIGAYSDASFPTQGQIDDVRIYNRALSASEIAGLYGSGAVKFTTSSVNLQAGSSLANGLVGVWTFDGLDVTDKVYDRSTQGNNGYLVGANNATSSRKTIGKLGQAFTFGGASTGGIDIGNGSALTPSRFTIAAWIYQNALSCYNYIYSNARDSGGTYQGIEFTVYCGGALTGTIWNSTANSINSVTPIPVGEWTHVAFSYDGSNKRLYINGIENNSSSQTTDPGTPASFNTYLGSMGYLSGTTYTLDGALDDVRIYSRSLSASEVKQLYNLGATTIKQ